MRGLTDKVAVVCAGGTGDANHLGASIGGVTARRLAAEGARVVVGDIDEAAAERTAQLIASEGGRAVAQHYDASDEAATQALMKRAITEFGGIDGVFFNALDGENSMKEAEADVCTIPLEVWHRQLDVGLLGLVLAARHSIESMLERGGGAIVATTSDAAYIGEPVRVAYAAAKAGLGAVVRHIASRWGRSGVRANTVSPGLVLSDNMRKDERLQSLMRDPARSTRHGMPDDIAAMVTLLISDDGAWVNGQAISVNGGSTIRP